jgi:hypothetical protein
MMTGLVLASSAPASASSVSPKAPIAAVVAGHCSLLADHGSVAIADSWTWDGFVKFWKQQLARTAGVVGVVMLVAAAAVAIIITRARR